MSRLSYQYNDYFKFCKELFLKIFSFPALFSFMLFESFKHFKMGTNGNRFYSTKIRMCLEFRKCCGKSMWLILWQYLNKILKILKCLSQYNTYTLYSYLNIYFVCKFTILCNVQSSVRNYEIETCYLDIDWRIAPMLIRQNLQTFHQNHRQQS